MKPGSQESKRGKDGRGKTVVIGDREGNKKRRDDNNWKGKKRERNQRSDLL